MLHKVFADSIKMSVVFTLLFLLALPGITAAETKELTIMLTEATYSAAAHRKVADKIEEIMGITVTFQTIPDTEFDNLARTKLVTKDLPDIFIMNVPGAYHTFRAQDTCLNLNDQPWFDRLLNPGFIEDEMGDIYAFPEQSTGGFVAALYNKKMFEELGLQVPSTYDELLTILEKGKQAGVIPFFASNKDLWTTQIFMTNGFPSLVSQHDPEIWDKLMTNQVKFADVPEFEMILSDYLELYTRGYVNEDHLTAGFEDAKKSFGEGKTLIWLMGTWAADIIQKEYPDVEVGIFRFPYREQDVLSVVKFVKGYLVPKGSGNEELALEFLNNLSQPDVFEIFFEENAGYPSIDGVDGGKTHPDARKLVEEYVNTGKYIYEMNAEVPIVGSIFTVLWELYVDMVSGKMTPKEVLETWDMRVEEFMISKGEPGW